MHKPKKPNPTTPITPSPAPITPAPTDNYRSEGSKGRPVGSINVLLPSAR